eukprot:6841871-Ditylum_brightwellii.AAC.1
MKQQAHHHKGGIAVDIRQHLRMISLAREGFRQPKNPLTQNYCYSGRRYENYTQSHLEPEVHSSSS